MKLSIDLDAARGTPGAASRLRPSGLGSGILALTLVLGLALGCEGAPDSDGGDLPTAHEAPPASAREIDRLFLVTLDTLRADHLGAYGYPRDTSPFLDEMAAGGVLFERAHAPMSTTVPSHATLFTSLYPIQHGVTKNGHVLGSEFLTLAEMLRARGFQTAGFVGTESQFAPGALDQGFDVFDQKPPDAETYRPADQTIDAALAWLESADPSRPLFLWVHLFDAHGPLIPPETYRRQFELRSKAQRDAMLAFLVDRRAARPESFSHGMTRMLDEHAKYDAEIRFADTELRRLHAGVGRLGLGGRALWIFTADHGEGMTRRPRLGHGRHIFQEQVHVPLILHTSDGFLEPRRVPDVVEHTDLMPTVAELVGAGDALAEQAAPIQGRSLLRLSRGLPDDPPRTALVQRRFYEAPPPGTLPGEYELGEKFALVDKNWKYIHRSIGGDELYHLYTDPYEERNMVDRIRGKTASMRRALLARVERLRATAPREAESVDEETLEKLRAMGYVE